jgi:hypothetical protein
MRIFQIKTNVELKIALARLDELWYSKDVKELDELDALATVISDYEDQMLIEDRKTQPEMIVKINDL